MSQLLSAYQLALNTSPRTPIFHWKTLQCGVSRGWGKQKPLCTWNHESALLSIKAYVYQHLHTVNSDQISVKTLKCTEHTADARKKKDFRSNMFPLLTLIASGENITWQPLVAHDQRAHSVLIITLHGFFLKKKIVQDTYKRIFCI